VLYVDDNRGHQEVASDRWWKMPSDKIKSKDLSYESSLPPFLQRLHAQKAGLGDQDRHERPIARPKRVKAHEDEDEPTVVDESGETVSKEDFEKMTSAAGQDGQAEPLKEGGNVKGTLKGGDEALVSGALPDASTSHKTDQKVTDGTTTKKRKVAKVVGDDDGKDDETTGDATDGKKDESTVKHAVKRIKKKAKPIKLAFDDGDDG
jgi:hypothetical protein